MRRIAGTILIILFVFFSAAGCSSKEITSQDVIGRYIANYDKDKVAVDSIEVRDDGTYTHYFKPTQDTNEFTDTGSWEFEYENGDPRMIFANFTIHYEKPQGYVSKYGFWSPIVQDGGDRLLIDEDIGLHYDKQK